MIWGRSGYDGGMGESRNTTVEVGDQGLARELSGQLELPELVLGEEIETGSEGGGRQGVYQGDVGKGRVGAAAVWLKRYHEAREKGDLSPEKRARDEIDVRLFLIRNGVDGVVKPESELVATTADGGVWAAFNYEREMIPLFEMWKECIQFVDKGLDEGNPIYLMLVKMAKIHKLRSEKGEGVVLHDRHWGNMGMNDGKVMVGDLEFAQMTADKGKLIGGQSEDVAFLVASIVVGTEVGKMREEAIAVDEEEKLRGRVVEEKPVDGVEVRRRIEGLLKATKERDLIDEVKRAYEFGGGVGVDREQLRARVKENVERILTEDFGLGIEKPGLMKRVWRRMRGGNG